MSLEENGERMPTGNTSTMIFFRGQNHRASVLLEELYPDSVITTVIPEYRDENEAQTNLSQDGGCNINDYRWSWSTATNRRTRRLIPIHQMVRFFFPTDVV